VQADGGGDDGLGPAGRARQVGWRGDFSLLHFEEQNEAGRLAFRRVGLG